MADGADITIVCADDVRLRGHLWEPESARLGTVIVNPATGVLARYYHHYARYLVTAGFRAITYDYRGIGLSRPVRLRGCDICWRDWGERDFDAVVDYVRSSDPQGLLCVVGHSIGGFLIGFAPNATKVDRILTVGAQYAYWRDYAEAHRRRLFMRWHVIMPVLTRLFGYFPGKRLKWLEDLPAGVADEWSFRRARMEVSYPAEERSLILSRFAAVRAPILALSMTDDEYGTEAALRRTLAYYTGADRRTAILAPETMGQTAVGHFAPFNARFRDSFWPITLAWLRDGSVLVPSTMILEG